MSDKNKYKDSLNLPATEFPMRGNLAKREPEILDQWQASNLYESIQDARKDAPLFVLHDGPPYSNGNIHYGHILNKVLKDLVVKYKTMAGFRSPYIPGWDTHGLPIELAVDRALGEKKRTLSQADFRGQCAEYALQFVDVQRKQFKRLGVFGAWEDPYLTLQHHYEAAIVRGLAAFARGGYLYRKNKPVYWSPGAQSALAEAEIEYKDHTSPSIYVKFELEDAAVDLPALAGKPLSLVIWTTTPWTLPANLAVVLHPTFDYVALRAPKRDEYLIVAAKLAEAVAEAIGADASTAIPLPADAIKSLEGKRYAHPFVAPMSEQAHRVWFADYVTLEQGTGLVHTAPGHGADDYVTGQKHGLPPYAPVDERGHYTDEVPEYAGEHVFKANPKIVTALHASGHLLNQPGETIHHSYPHCWRTKGPIIFRATPQWFLKIDHNEFRERALAEIKATEWIPSWSENRIDAMIGGRPDWCLSRQRAWGVPIPVVYCQKCDEAIADAQVMEHVAKVFSERGADAWYTDAAEKLLPADFACPSCQAGAADMTLGKDIVDVWFESGCSWLAISADPFALPQIDMYLEGSDQHRGWFHSSLLVALGVKGKAPYKHVMTHGFVLDEHGVPYSKSALEKAAQAGKKTKYIAPDSVIESRGAEILRLWVASTDFKHDITYSEDLLRGVTDWYRKFRNTARFMLGNLHDFDPETHTLDTVELSALDKQALARLGDVIAGIRASYDAYDFHQVHRSLVEYITTELSALYLDVVKDCLYADAPDSPARRAAQAVIYQALRSITLVAAPILCFTAEDIWKHMPKHKDDPESVHMALMPKGKPAADDASWAVFMKYRELTLKALEEFRQKKNKSLDAAVTLTATSDDAVHLQGQEELLAALFVVSKVSIETGNEPASVVVNHQGEQCSRCWRWFDQLSTDITDVCTRCADALAALNK